MPRFTGHFCFNTGETEFFFTTEATEKRQEKYGCNALNNFKP
jgi:oxalate decarboxylase/phosphoglucose isomerase-like protein (cupin superfamily)